MVLPPGRLSPDESADAAAYLAWNRGLQRVAGGSVWLSSTERQVRANLEVLGSLRRDVLRAQRRLDDRIRKNYVAWEASRQQIAALQQILASRDTKDSEERKIRQQIDDLQSRAVAPDKLGAEPDVRALVIRLANQRNRLALALIALRRSIPRITPEYERLAADTRVQQALEKLGPNHRLGPLSENYNQHLRNLPEYERIVFTSWVPIYLQSGNVRVDTIVNEQTPVTVTWMTSNEPLVLTDALAEVVGLDRETTISDPLAIQVEPGRTLSAQPVTVDTIRLGRHVVHDVRAFVLPPEAEDLGARMGVATWSEYAVTLQLDGLRLVIEPPVSNDARD
jgi:hypothetical protein